MEKSQLKQLLEQDSVSVEFCAGEHTYSAEPLMVFSVNEKTGEADFKISGFTLNCNEKISNFDNFEDFYKQFEGKDCRLIRIDGKFDSIEDFEKQKQFDNINTEGLLETFLPVADSFSLTCPYNGGYDREHTFGIYKLDKRLADAALKQVYCYSKDFSKKQFEAIPEKEKKKLPPFETLYDEVLKECLLYRKKHSGTLAECGGQAFFCDEFGRGKTKYKKPENLWHVYASVDFAETCKYVLEQMQANALERSLDCELDDPEYAELKNSVIRIDVGFIWHCTVSGLLSKTYFFKLDESTVKWLKKFKNDYEFSGLEDLAFYKDGEVIFSSCTHERFHTKTDK